MQPLAAERGAEPSRDAERNELGCCALRPGMLLGNDVDAVQRVLANGASPDEWGDTCDLSGVSGLPVHLAAALGRLEILRVLAAHNANLDAHATDRHGGDDGSALYAAYRGEGGIEAIDVLLDGGASADACAYNGSTLLFVATQDKRGEVVNRLLNVGADSNRITSDYYGAPIDVALGAGSTEIYIAMLQHGGKPQESGRALRYKRSRILFLKGEISDPDALRRDRRRLSRALYRAIEDSQVRFVRKLIALGADANGRPRPSREYGGRYPAPGVLAVQNKNPGILRAILRANPELWPVVNEARAYHCYAPIAAHIAERPGILLPRIVRRGIHMACRIGDANSLRKLLVRGEGIAPDETDFETAMRTAIAHDHANLMPVMLAHGADPYRFLVGCKGGPCMVVLVEALTGRAGELDDKHLSFALMQAAYAGCLEAVKTFLGHGAHITGVPKRPSPLVLARRAGHADVAAFLADYEATVRASVRP